LSKITGRIDHMGRPIIGLHIKDESVLVMVDTGFNGQLMMNETGARIFGFSVMKSKSEIVLADDQKQSVLEGFGYLRWFGQLREVSLFITEDQHIVRRDDDPIAIIGTELLTPHLLEMDFAKRTVAIKSQKSTG